MARRIRRRTGRAFVLFLAAAAAAWLAAAETGEIKGKVTDDEGQGLPGVQIQASGPALQGVRAVLSGRNGEFHLPILPVGRYSLTFTLEGFGTVVQEGVLVRLGLTTTLTVSMPLASLKAEVIVTADPPLIDKTSADTSYRVGAVDLEKLPTQTRTVADVVKFAPGAAGVRTDTRRGTSSEGQPSIRGEGEEGNNWIVDGLSISGVRLKDSGIRLNYEALEEIQVISDPFSPEYGAAFGGIINMVTKSGSNRFRGEAGLLGLDKRLQAGREPQLATISAPDSFSDVNAYLNLGGPIVQDKLWFFLSENYARAVQETRDGVLDYLSVPAGRKSTGTNNLFTKLSFAPHPNHNVSLTAIFARSLPQKGAVGLPEMNETVRSEDLVLRLNYKGILSPRTFVEAGIGRVGRNLRRTPDDGDLGPAMYFIEDLGRNIHNSYGDVTDDEGRMDAGFKLTTHVETETFGRHEVTAGVEYYQVDSKFRVGFSGRAADLFPGNGFDAGTKYFFDSWRDGRGTPTFFYEYGDFDFINSSRGFGFFLKDKVSWDRFTLMAGLRTQTQTCRDAGGKTLWTWGPGDFLSPRLSLAVDLGKDGRNVLKLAWGRFSDLITTMPLGFFNTGAGLTFRTYRWAGPSSPSESELRDPAFWTFETEQKTQAFEISPRIKPNAQTRWLVEFDRRIGRTWAAKARFVRTKSENLLEVLALFDLETLYRFLYDNFEHKRRDYTGFEFEIGGSVGQSLFLSASYAHALARGTNPGQSESGAWSQDEGSTTYLGLFGNHIYVPPLPELAAIKDWADTALGGLGGRGVGDEGWYGKLPYSVDHNVKINALYAAPFGISVAGAFEYLSGYPWEKLGYVPFFGGYYAFPEGRGSRMSQGHAYLDLSVEKAFPLGGGGPIDGPALSLRLDVFNLFDSQRPVSFVKEDIPIFGSVWGRQAPRQARLSARFKF